MDISVTVCLFVCLFVCTVTDFSAEDKASGVKFCTAVHRHPRQGISHFGELCFLRSPKSDESASMADRRQSPPLTENARGTPGHALGMCGYTTVPPDVLVRISAIPVSQKYDR